jgi:hypothetical protein
MPRSRVLDSWSRTGLLPNVLCDTYSDRSIIQNGLVFGKMTTSLSERLTDFQLEFAYSFIKTFIRDSKTI